MKVCEACGHKPSRVVGTKTERLEYYIDAAIRLGACLGQWTENGDSTVNLAGGEGVRAIKEVLMGAVVRIAQEPEPEPDKKEGN